MSEIPRSSPASLLQLVMDYPLAQVVHHAARLRLADLLADGPRSVEDLAEATGTHAPSLSRLLRALAALDIVAQEPDGRVSLTPRGAPLRGDVPNSIRDSVLFFVGDWYWRTWDSLLHSVQTGRPAFDHVFGMSNFDYWGRHPAAAAIHDGNFTAMAHLAVAPLVAAYDFGRFNVIADIGGGQGPLLAGILAANPAVRGILFDLPHVVAGAPEILGAAAVGGRCTVVGGDFFRLVPPGADGYLLKYIIHNWDDERAVAVLQRCRAAMAASGTLLLIEHVLPERWETGTTAVRPTVIDMHMLVMTPGGRERTETEFQRLLERAGFELRRVIPTQSPFSILEGRPV